MSLLFVAVQPTPETNFDRDFTLVLKIRCKTLGCVSRFISNKTHAQAFTPPTDEKKMGTILIFVYYAVYGSRRGRCRNFLLLNWGEGDLHLQIWDLNRAHETERTVFPIPQVFSMCRRRL